jgi:hypothetical protein
VIRDSDWLGITKYGVMTETPSTPSPAIFVVALLARAFRPVPA